MQTKKAIKNQKIPPQGQSNKKVFEKQNKNNKNESEFKMKKTVKNTYRQVKKELQKHVSIIHLTKKELGLVYEAQKTGDLSAVYQTKIYSKYGGEYCALQEVIYELFGKKEDK